MQFRCVYAELKRVITTSLYDRQRISRDVNAETSMILPIDFFHPVSAYELRDIAFEASATVEQPVDGFLLRTHVVKPQTTARIKGHAIHTSDASFSDIVLAGIATISRGD